MTITIGTLTYRVVNEWDLTRFLLAWRQTEDQALKCWKWRVQ